MKYTTELLDELRQASRARREAHPDWPAHRPELYLPGGEVRTVSVVLPTGKLPGIGYCKYCHQKHRNWWMMDQRDYDIDGLTIILCGECEHTSATAFADYAAPTGSPIS